jgi:hypothetical protein
MPQSWAMGHIILLPLGIFRMPKKSNGFGQV